MENLQYYLINMKRELLELQNYINPINILIFKKKEYQNYFINLLSNHQSMFTFQEYPFLCRKKAFIEAIGDQQMKRIKELRKLYKEFLDNYRKLNQDLNLENPLEIFIVFNHLVNRGFISADHHFVFGENEFYDIPYLAGIEVINGTGVCRHLSSLLTDIYENMGILASNLVVYTKKYRPIICLISEEKYTKEQLHDWINDYITIVPDAENLIKAVDELLLTNNVELFLQELDSRNYMERKNGNHAITYARYNDDDYFLDPTTFRVLHQTSPQYIEDHIGQMQIKLASTLQLDALHNTKNYLKMRQNIQSNFQSLPSEEQKKLIANTKELCQNNEDFFDDFYQENTELYKEMVNKLVITKKSSIIK